MSFPEPPERLVADLRELGVRAGDLIMVHASLRAIGPVEGGAQAVLAALEEAVGNGGTLLMILGAAGAAEWMHEPPDASTVSALPPERCFHALRTAAHPEVGWLAEVFRRASGTLVSHHPMGRFGARGRLARKLLENAPWHDYYGADSPLDRLCRAGGRVLRLGADPDTVTLLHWAEYLAPLARKRRIRRFVAVAGTAGPEIRHVDALDDEAGIVPWDGDDYFGLLLEDYLETGSGRRGRVAGAASELIDANDLIGFALPWMKERLGRTA
jgi:aminoglycoside N3'-acetyltransferase